MHELGYTRPIVDTVLAAADNAHAHEVRGVYLTIGELRDIVDDLFRGCFSHFTKGTIAEGSKLEITRVPFTVTCRTCGTVHPANIYDDDSFICPSCGDKDYMLKTGMEFQIDHIEVA